MDEALRAVADPTRRAILRLVRDRSCRWRDRRHFPSISRPAVSQHLRVLTDAGLVEVRPDGNRRLYRWRREGLRDAATFLDEMWADDFARLKVAAEREEWPERTRARANLTAPTTAKGNAAVTETDTNVVEQTLRIGARPETVWQYWTDPQQMCDWWGAAAELDPRPGGACRIEMGGGPVMVGEYLELVPYERIVFSFGWEPTDGAPPIAPGPSRVEVTLIDGRRRHHPHPAPHRHPRCARRPAPAGWSHFLPLLAAAAV